jgi:cation diffusion facilitator family transporter
VDAAALRLRRRAAALSLAIAVLLLGIKGAAWVVTGSAAVLADALESVVHVLAIAVMYGVVRFTAAPPDDDHPYGHGRAEALSVGVEGGAIALAGLAILAQTGVSLATQAQPSHLGWGAGLIGAAAAINLALGWWLIRVGRQVRSDVLTADGHHVLSDVWTSAGVLIGLGLCAILPAGPWRTAADATVAVGCAGFILAVGLRLLRRAAASLLDEADPTLVQAVIDAINRHRDPAWLDIHHLRARRAGDLVYIDFHLTVPGHWTVAQAHDAVEGLEHAILAHLDRAGAVMIHLDHPGPGHPGSPEPLTLARATRRGPPT